MVKQRINRCHLFVKGRDWVWAISTHFWCTLVQSDALLMEKNCWLDKRWLWTVCHMLSLPGWPPQTLSLSDSKSIRHWVQPPRVSRTDRLWGHWPLQDFQPYCSWKIVWQTTQPDEGRGANPADMNISKLWFLDPHIWFCYELAYYIYILPCLCNCLLFTILQGDLFTYIRGFQCCTIS